MRNISIKQFRSPALCVCRRACSTEQSAAFGAEKASLDLKAIRNREVNDRWTRLKEARDLVETPLPPELVPRPVAFTDLGDRLKDADTANTALLLAIEEQGDKGGLSVIDHVQLWKVVLPQLAAGEIDENIKDLIGRLVPDLKLRLHDHSAASLSLLGAALSTPAAIIVAAQVPCLSSLMLSIGEHIAPPPTKGDGDRARLLSATPRIAVRALNSVSAAESSGVHCGEGIQSSTTGIAERLGKPVTNSAISLQLNEWVHMLNAVAKFEKDETKKAVEKFTSNVVKMLTPDAPLLGLESFSQILCAIPHLPDSIKSLPEIEELASMTMKTVIRRRRSFPTRIVSPLAEAMGKLNMMQCKYQSAFYRAHYMHMMPLLSWTERTQLAYAIPQFHHEFDFAPDSIKNDIKEMLSIVNTETITQNPNPGVVWHEALSAARAIWSAAYAELEMGEDKPAEDAEEEKEGEEAGEVEAKEVPLPIKLANEVKRAVFTNKPADNWPRESKTYRQALVMIAEAKAKKPEYFQDIQWPDWVDGQIESALEFEAEEFRNSDVIKEMLALAGEGWEAGVRVPTATLSWPVALKNENKIIDIDFSSPRTLRSTFLASPPPAAEGEEAPAAPKVSVITTLSWSKRNAEQRKELFEQLTGDDAPPLIRDSNSQSMSTADIHAFKV